MCRIRSGATTDYLTVDPTSKAARMTPYDTTGRSLAPESKATYMASGSFTPPATPTDLVTIYGSASKTVRIRSMKIGTANTAAGSQIFTLVKRSTVNTTGTFVAATAVPVVSTSAAATATPGHYTVVPGGLGTAVGTVNTVKVGTPVITPATWAGINTTDNDKEMLPASSEPSLLAQPITLIGVTEGLAINFGAAALVAGQIHTYTIVWTEE